MHKTAVITGASRGIGREIALRVARMGLNVFLLARDEQELKAVSNLCQRAGVKAHYLAGSLVDEEYMDEAIANVNTTLGGIDILVNNAGTAEQQPVQHANLVAWRNVMELNFNSVVYLCNKILPQMIEARQGTIINISSLAGKSTTAGNGIYSASKFALNGFSECMYEDVRDYNIKISTILPGFVDTDLTRTMGLKNDQMMTVADVADSVEYVLRTSPRCCPTEILLRPQQRPKAN